MLETRNPRPTYLRPTILLLLGIVALIAIALGAVRYRKDVDARARQALWKAALARAEARVAWSQEMVRPGRDGHGGPVGVGQDQDAIACVAWPSPNRCRPVVSSTERWLASSVRSSIPRSLPRPAGRPRIG